MDDIVRAAMAKWPSVPDCWGWLALDARGDWYLRDQPTQAAGPFPQHKGSRILHDALREFIHRNYASDASGAWFFQNGPQRVYVELEAAPWVWRVQPANAGVAEVQSHTGRDAQFESAWLDDGGRLFIATDLGLGLVHSLDMEAASTHVESGRWPIGEVRFDELPLRFGYRLSPAAARTVG